jgi:ABC-type multidrug transport system fused ATPase/permease subunit
MYTVQTVSNFIFQIVLVNYMLGVPIWPVLCLMGVIIPAIMATVYCREAKAIQLLHSRQDAEDKWVHAVNDIVTHRHVINAYGKMLDTMDNFKVLYEDFYNKHRRADFYKQTSTWIAGWCLASILFGLYTLGPFLVDEFNISAGDMAAVIKSWLKLESGFKKLYKAVLKMQRSIVALEIVADILNRPTMYQEWLDNTRIDSAADKVAESHGLAVSSEGWETARMRESTEHERLHKLSDVDYIRFNAVSFDYYHKHRAGEIANATQMASAGDSNTTNVWSHANAVSNAGMKLSKRLETVRKNEQTLSRKLTKTLSKTTSWKADRSPKPRQGVDESQRWQLKDANIDIQSEGRLILVVGQNDPGKGATCAHCHESRNTSCDTVACDCLRCLRPHLPPLGTHPVAPLLWGL